jgi:hypothetical protein
MSPKNGTTKTSSPDELRDDAERRREPMDYESLLVRQQAVPDHDVLGEEQVRPRTR